MGFSHSGGQWARTGHSPHPPWTQMLLGAIASGFLCWGRGSAGKVPLTLSVSSRLVFFLSFWNSSLGRLNFYRFFLIPWYSPGSPLSRVSLTVAKRGWDRFAGCADSPKVYLPVTRYACGRDSSQGPACGAGSHSSHRGSFGFGWVPHLLLKRGTEMEEMSYATS